MTLVEAVRPLSPRPRSFLSFPLDNTEAVPEVIAAFDYKLPGGDVKPYTVRFVPIRDAAKELSVAAKDYAFWNQYYPLHAVELFNGRFEAIAIAREYEPGAAVKPGYYTQTGMKQSTFHDILNYARGVIHEECHWFSRDWLSGSDVPELVVKHREALFRTARSDRYFMDRLHYDKMMLHLSRPPLIPDMLLVEKRDGIEQLLAA